MKVTPKYLSGGFMSLFSTYEPVGIKTTAQQATLQTTLSTKKEKEDDSISTKDLLEMLNKIDGLPNDMLQLAKGILDILDLQTLGISSASDTAEAYLSSLLQLKQANFNKKEYDKAYKAVESTGGLNEVAITSSGGIIVLDKDSNEIKLVGVQEYLQNKSNYEPYTNSNLLYLRAYHPEYSNSNRILETVSNGIGLTLVNKIIKSYVSNLGSTELIREGYSLKEKNLIVAGLDILKNILGDSGMTVDGLYKNRLITKEQSEQAKAALVYIYSMLPTNALTLLLIRGNNASNPLKGATDIIAALITSRVNSSFSLTSNYEASTEDALSGNVKSSKKGESKKSDSEAKSGPYTDMVRLIGGTKTHITLNNGTNYLIGVDGTNYPSIVDTSGKPVGRTSLDNLLNSGLQGIITDRNAITFGDVPLSDTDFTNIVYNGNGGTMAILPARKNTAGLKVVDLDALDRWEAANKELKSMGIDSIEDTEHTAQIIQILQKHNLSSLVSFSTGDINYDAIGQFLIIDGYMVDKSDLEKFLSSKYIRLFDVDDLTKALIEKALSTNNDLDNYKIEDGWFSSDDVYRGSIYIPITSNEHQALTAEGLKLNKSVALKEEGNFQRFEKMELAKTGKSNVL